VWMRENSPPRVTFLAGDDFHARASISLEGTTRKLGPTKKNCGVFLTLTVNKNHIKSSL